MCLRMSTGTVACVAPLWTGPNNIQLHFKTLCKKAATKQALPSLTSTAWFLADTRHFADNVSGVDMIHATFHAASIPKVHQQSPSCHSIEWASTGSILLNSGLDTSCQNYLCSKIILFGKNNYFNNPRLYKLHIRLLLFFMLPIWQLYTCYCFPSLYWFSLLTNICWRLNEALVCVQTVHSL